MSIWPCVLRSFSRILVGILSLNIHALESDLTVPDNFQIQQGRWTRIFYLLDEQWSFLGAVLNTSYARLDFYDGNREKRWANYHDALYGSSGEYLGSVEYLKSEGKFRLGRWIIPYSERVNLFSAEGRMLAYLQVEGQRSDFVLRLAETDELVALAIWNAPYWETNDVWRHEWHVRIRNRPLLEQKGISILLLVEALLRHSQMHLPSSESVGYHQRLPSDLEFYIDECRQFSLWSCGNG